MLQTTATNINGKEVRELIDIHYKKFMNSIPGLGMDRSYRRAVISFAYQLGEYPGDVPTPKKDIIIQIDSPATISGENDDHFAAIKALENYREHLIAKLQEVNEQLNVVNPVYEAEVQMEAGDKPDQLRVENGLPIPVVTKVGGKHVEQYVDVKKSGTKLQFGKQREIAK